MEVFITALSASIGFSTANFFYQWMSTKDYEKAFERSFFQVVAIFSFALTIWMQP